MAALGARIMLPRIQPMRLSRIAKPFDDPDYVFELKHGRPGAQTSPSIIAFCTNIFPSDSFRDANDWN